MYQCACGNHRRLKCIIKVTKSEEFCALRLSVAQKFKLCIYIMIVCIFSMSFFFIHSALLRRDSGYALGLNHDCIHSLFFATEDWKQWMEWGLMTELDHGNLGLIPHVALEFSFNTIKSVRLFIRDHLLYVLHFMEVWLCRSLSGAQGMLPEAIHVIFAVSANCICSLALKTC